MCTPSLPASLVAGGLIWLVMIIALTVQGAPTPQPAAGLSDAPTAMAMSAEAR